MEAIYDNPEASPTCEVAAEIYNIIITLKQYVQRSEICEFPVFSAVLAI